MREDPGRLSSTVFSSNVAGKTTMDRNREFQRSLYDWYTRGCLYRFLPECVATKTRDTGVYRLNASGGAASLPTAAQRDNEHEKRIKILGSGGEGEILNEGDDLRSRVVEEGGDTTIFVETDRPYYFSSFTLDLTRKLYQDFGDTALVDHRSRRVFRAIAQRGQRKRVAFSKRPCEIHRLRRRVWPGRGFG